jgi:hypothetical protein
MEVGEGEESVCTILRRRRLTTARPAYLARLLPESGQMVMLVIDCTTATGMASGGD